MADPAAFDVTYVINPHMEGNVGRVDRARARPQWAALRDAYVRLGLAVDVLPAAEGLPDLVFTANQSFPIADRRVVLMSRMHAEQRRAEVPLVEAWYAARGWRIAHLGEDVADFEGMGDALWHPGRRFVWGGYGFRSSLRAYEALSALADVPVVALSLRDPRFYHLDTCLAPLDAHTALYVEEAFDETGLRLLREGFERLIRVPIADAERFACNGHCPDGEHFLVQAGCGVSREVAAAGFAVVELETDEFTKSGGSVFCMKMMVD
ncbi:MAG: dimethylarginine dimethylaminohydrolase family protein [Myxococcota bacterium]